jgi:adenosylcobinamide-phosphate synthase
VVTSAALLLAVWLDRWLGEPQRFHPLVGFGRWANALEHRLNANGQGTQLRGLVALLLCIMPVLLLSAWLCWGLLHNSALLTLLVGSIGLYFTVGWRSLIDHAAAVEQALAAPNLPLARQAVGRIVSRDCEALSALQVRRAALESLLENTADAVIAPLFWFALLGLPGALVYRLSNTLDAMWGYKNKRFYSFGWAAARWDDALNYLPARCTAWAFAAVGDTAGALASWRSSAAHWASPSAGPVICAGAGALHLSVGGGASYHQRWHDKPATPGHLPQAGAITRGLQLVQRAVVLLLAVFSLMALLLNGASV